LFNGLISAESMGLSDPSKVASSREKFNNKASVDSGFN
jgi:hypothetical protein